MLAPKYIFGYLACAIVFAVMTFTLQSDNQHKAEEIAKNPSFTGPGDPYFDPANAYVLPVGLAVSGGLFLLFLGSSILFIAAKTKR